MQRISDNDVTQGKHGAYNAVDIGPHPDPDWYAPEDVTVTEIHTKDDNTCGKYIRLKGSTGVHTVCHNEKFYVKVGQKLSRGQKVARMGYTGYTEPDNVPAGTHAHWILNIKGVWVYPLSKVNQKFIKENDMYKGHSAKYWYDKYQASHKNSLKRRSILDKIKGLVGK